MNLRISIFLSTEVPENHAVANLPKGELDVATVTEWTLTIHIFFLGT